MKKESSTRKKIIAVGMMAGLLALTGCGQVLSGTGDNIAGSSDSRNEKDTVVIKRETTEKETTKNNKEKDDKHYFIVNDLDEVRLQADKSSDLYATSVSGPDNLFYIDQDGTLWGSGSNEFGQLGQGTKSEESDQEAEGNTRTPKKIAEHVVHVSYSATGFLLYLTEQGDLYGAGTNATGALLDNTKNDADRFLNPTMDTVNTPVRLMTDVQYAQAGKGNVLVLKKDNSVWAWGIQSVTDGMNWNYIENPKKIFEDASFISTGWNNSAVLLQDGSVWTWGYNFCGNCGVDNKGGGYYVTKPVKVAEGVKRIWANQLEVNTGKDQKTKMEEKTNIWPDSFEDTIIEKKDGSLYACGEGLGHTVQTISSYYESGDPEEIVFSCGFVPCGIREKTVSESGRYQMDLSQKGQISVYDIADQKGKVNLLTIQKKDYYDPAAIEISDVDNVLGQSGFRIKMVTDDTGYRKCLYYAVVPGKSVKDEKAVKIAESSGYEKESGDLITDIDGDGIRELICNIVREDNSAEDAEESLIDGSRDVIVYDVRDGKVQVGEASDQLDVEHEGNGEESVQAQYDINKKKFVFDYFPKGQTDDYAEKEMTPDLSKIHFKNFP